MPLDKLHILVLIFLWVLGLVSMVITFPKVSRIRRATYYFAMPVWVAWIAIYAHSFITFPDDPGQHIVGWWGILLRVALGTIAILGILVPLVDRLEREAIVEVVRVEVRNDE